MRHVHEAGRVGALGKRLAPTLTRIVTAPGLRGATRFVGIYIDILQGKGAGTGWDIAGEASAAVRFLNSPTPIIFDVGANRGQWSVEVARCLGGRGRFLLVEPQSSCHEGYAGLGLPQATFIRAAFSSECGTLELRSDGAGSETASMYERHDTYLPEQTHTELVPVVTLDSELARLGIDRVDLVKLDVEGSERAVLQGASGALKAGALRTVAFEFGSADVYSRTFFRDLWEIFVERGYRVWRICPGGVLLSVPDYREDLENFRGVSNYIASLDLPATGPPRARVLNDRPRLAAPRPASAHE